MAKKSSKSQKPYPFTKIRKTIHEVIFEADTLSGKIFDVVLIILILLSVLVVMLDSVQEWRMAYGKWFYILEWVFTILFTIEYILRLISIGKPLKYALSFFGIVDLLAILPTYITLIVPGSQYLLTIRILRVLRIFRVLKLVKYLGEAQTLASAIHASRRKIIVFLFVVLTCSVIMGSAMYMIEGPENGYSSIPRGIYWAIVTLTTVGYGDISPKSDFGQFISSFIMIMGYGILAVPTGIVTVELSRIKDSGKVTTQVCQECLAEGHDHDAKYCKHCGTPLV